MRESRDPFSATNMMNKNLMNDYVKNLFKKDSDSSPSYYNSTSPKESKREKILAQNTPVSLALEKRLEEIEKAIYSRPSGSANLIKIIKSYFTGR
jgi:hypothetical protein